MPKAYSLDLRERVVAFVEDGHSRRAAPPHFTTKENETVGGSRPGTARPFNESEAARRYRAAHSCSG
jgi:hypothetical protein